MFDFENFPVYKKAEENYIAVSKILVSSNISINLRDQLKRASTSIVLNIAEGTGKSSSREKRKFLIISRSSLLETVAIIDILYKRGLVGIKEYEYIESKAEEISKILFKMIQNLESK